MPNHDTGYTARQVLSMLRGNQIKEALALCERAVQVNPDDGPAWTLLAYAFGVSGQPLKAIACGERAVRLHPDSTDAHMNLGNALFQADRFQQAAQCFQRVTELVPASAAAWLMLAKTKGQTGLFQETERHARKALELDAQSHEARFVLANSLLSQDRPDEAVRIYREILATSPGAAEVHYCLGGALHRQGKFADAVACYTEAIRLQPGSVFAYNAKGQAQHAQGKTREAIETYQSALKLAPREAALYTHLGNALASQGRLDEATASYREALKLRPDLAQAHNNLGNVLHAQGLVDDAERSYDEALRLKPDFTEAHSNLLFCMNYNPRHTPAALFEAHLAWAALHAQSPRRDTAYAVRPEPDRRLRLGYVSPDFRTHPVAYFISPLLQHHDRNRFEVICYAEVSKPDETTARLRALSDGWRSTCGMSADKMAETIRSDAIDILVDLAGHTSNNRLPVFAHRPSPVQVSYLGYPNTTGLDAIGYRLTDNTADPSGSERFYTEKLVYVAECFACYAPPADASDVSPLPARDSGAVTFGSLNNLSKLNEAVVRLWCEVLRVVPSARLLICRRTLKGRVKERFQRLFADRGHGPERVELLGAIPSEMNHLSLYHRIDIGLDTFPWNGHTTTCESLWMGVPVVTLYGDRHAGRICASVLKAVGLERLIARDPGEYVRIATGLANDLDELERLRAGMRDRLRASALCDGAGFTRRLEQAYREMWGEWCLGTTVST